jgi:2OG-Fe(II) oxygenase superfamily
MKKPLIFNGIAVYRQAIDCSLELISAIESFVKYVPGIEWLPSKVVHSDGTETRDQVRTNYYISLADHAQKEARYNEWSFVGINAAIHDAVSHCVLDYNSRIGSDINPNVSQNYMILRYEGGQNYVSHLDHGVHTPRRLSGIGYLNDDFQGGELRFEHMNFTYHPAAGDVVLFPSGLPYQHAALPVTSGTKYSVVNWWN